MYEEEDPPKRDPILSQGWMFYDLPLNPEPWKIGPLSMGRRSGGSMYPMIGRDKQLYGYQMAIKEQLSKWNTLLLPGMYVAQYHFWRRRDAYTTEKSRQVRKHEADLTNMLKATEDACQSVLFGNDVDCVGHTNYVFEQGKGVSARVVIGVAPVSERLHPRQVMSAELIEQLKL